MENNPKLNTRSLRVLVLTLVLITTISEKSYCQTANEKVKQEARILNVYQNDVLDNPAEFPGGKNALEKFLKDKFKAPDDVRAAGIRRIILNFIVEPDGSVSNPRIVRGLGSDTEREAIKALLVQMPKFNGAVHKGNAVRVSFTIGIPVD